MAGLIKRRSCIWFWFVQFQPSYSSPSFKAIQWGYKTPWKQLSVKVWSRAKKILQDPALWSLLLSFLTWGSGILSLVLFFLFENMGAAIADRNVRIKTSLDIDSQLARQVSEKFKAISGLLMPWNRDLPSDVLSEALVETWWKNVDAFWALAWWTPRSLPTQAHNETERSDSTFPWFGQLPSLLLESWHALLKDQLHHLVKFVDFAERAEIREVLCHAWTTVAFASS